MTVEFKADVMDEQSQVKAKGIASLIGVLRCLGIAPSSWYRPTSHGKRGPRPRPVAPEKAREAAHNGGFFRTSADAGHRQRWMLHVQKVPRLCEPAFQSCPHPVSNSHPAGLAGVVSWHLERRRSVLDVTINVKVLYHL